MKSAELYRPTVAMAYVTLALELAAERGIDCVQLLRNLGITREQLQQPDGRVSALQYGRLSARLQRLSGDPALGYEFGLRNRLCVHGLFGYGLISQRTLRDAVQFLICYARLRMPAFHLGLVEDRVGVGIELTEALQLGPLQQYAADAWLASLVVALRAVLADSEMELWFRCAEPARYAHYRERLPPARFAMGSNQLRLPSQALDRALGTANAETAQLIRHHCERETALVNIDGDFIGRIRAMLMAGDRGYPQQDELAQRLCISSRTLKRRLREHGFSFQELLDAARHRDAVHLLQESNLRVEQIAVRLGYADRASFTRACRRFSGATPSSLRPAAAAARTGRYLETGSCR